MAPKFTFEDRLQQLLDFEAENSHMIVAQSYKTNGLGKWVNNTRLNKTKNKVKPEEIAALDKIGFVWVAPKGPEKDALIEWGKHFRLLVDFHKTKNHCNVPAKIAGKPNPTAAWCDEQRQLQMEGNLSKEKYDKLSGIGFDFYGSSEEDKEATVSLNICMIESLLATSLCRSACLTLCMPLSSLIQATKRKRVDNDEEMELLKNLVETLQKENAELKEELQKYKHNGI